MTQLSLPLPMPSSLAGADTVIRGVVMCWHARRTLLDKRKTPRGSRDVILTDHEVELVRQLSDMGISQAEIARKFEVSKQHIHDLVHHRRRAYAA